MHAIVVVVHYYLVLVRAATAAAGARHRVKRGAHVLIGGQTDVFLLRLHLNLIFLNTLNQNSSDVLRAASLHLFGLVMLVQKSRILSAHEGLKLRLWSIGLNNIGLEVRGAKFTLGNELKH
jgi:hypothetical protein